MKRKRSSLARNLAVALVAAALAQGCALDFSGDNFQRLKTFFKLTETLAAGNATLVHSWFFPSALAVKKNWVQVSGAVVAPGGALPATVTVVATFEDMAGRQLQKVTLKVKPKANGTFAAKKKIPKNIEADSLMMVTVQPAGRALESGTELTLCVDLVEKKGDLKSLPVCAEGGPAGAATLTELQRDIFTPTCDSFGCHNIDSAREGLVLQAGMSFENLVDVPSNQQAQFDRVEPGDPEASYLVKKLRGDAGIEGERMPDGGPFLTAAELARVVSWINAGAPDN